MIQIKNRLNVLSSQTRRYVDIYQKKTLFSVLMALITMAVMAHHNIKEIRHVVITL